MKLFIYTMPYEIHNEAQKINNLFAGGLDCLHIRKPKVSADEIESLVAAIDKKYHSKIVLHSNYSLATKYQLKGIHIDDKDFFTRQYVRFLKIKNPNLQITATAKKVNELESIGDHINYTLLGPLYLKYSEENIQPKFDVFQLKTIIKKSKKPIVALGGITTKNIQQVKQLGFQTVALQSSIWKATDYLKAFEAFKMSVEKSESKIRKLAV